MVLPYGIEIKKTKSCIMNAMLVPADWSRQNFVDDKNFVWWKPTNQPTTKNRKTGLTARNIKYLETKIVICPLHATYPENLLHCSDRRNKRMRCGSHRFRQVEIEWLK